MTPSQMPIWDELRQIADELEVKIHLAGMDARDRWKQLQPRLGELQRAIESGGKRASEAVSETLTEINEALHELRDQVKDEIDRPKA